MYLTVILFLLGAIAQLVTLKVVHSIQFLLVLNLITLIIAIVAFRRSRR